MTTPRVAVELSGPDAFDVPIQPAVPTRTQAFEDAYRAHYCDVHRYLLAFTGSTDDADEIASETFERALRTWQRAPDPALPWLLLTARRIATDRWRRARRWAQLALGLHRDERGDAGERRTEFWLWFADVSMLLTHRQREVLLLRYHRDLSDADIASIMGSRNRGSARSLAARSRSFAPTRSCSDVNLANRFRAHRPIPSPLRRDRGGRTRRSCDPAARAQAHNGTGPSRAT